MARVLHFYKTALPDTVGGTEQVINQLARTSSRHGFDATVLALTRRAAADIVRYEGYDVHRVPLDVELASTGCSLAVVRHFRELADAADLVHYHFPWPFMDMVHFLVRTRKPSLVTYHSDIVRQRALLHLYRPLQTRFLASVDRVVATSPNYLATSKVLRKLGDKVAVVPIGIDRPDTLRPDTAGPDAACLDFWRQRLGERFFLFCGVFRYYKGLHILLDAAVGADYPIVLIGAGPIEAALRAQAARLGLGNVHFLGHLPEVDKLALLTLCHGVVFPSHLRAEAFGVSLLEGAMYGKPMISSEIGTGTTFVNIHGETGLVVPPGDPTALRAAMDWLWNDPALAGAMGGRAAARHQALFTGERMTAAYAGLYRELLDRKAGGQS